MDGAIWVENDTLWNIFGHSFPNFDVNPPLLILYSISEPTPLVLVLLIAIGFLLHFQGVV